MFVLLVVVLLFGFGSWVNGARVWFVFGFLLLQLVELVKLVLVVYCADLFVCWVDCMHEVWVMLWFVMLMFGLMVMLVML